MGQKVNPHGMRVGVIKDWDSRWYARDEKVGDLIVEDYKIREYLKKTLYSAGIPNIEIETPNGVFRGVFRSQSESTIVIETKPGTDYPIPRSFVRKIKTL